MITGKILDWNVYDGIVIEPDAKNNCQSIANASAAFSRNPARGAFQKEMKDRAGTNEPPRRFAKRIK